jgi:hypothetical protein
MLALYREAYRGWNVKHFHEHLLLSCTTACSSAMTPESLRSASIACAGFMPNASFTSSTPSRSKTAPPRQACAPPSGSSTAISRLPLRAHGAAQVRAGSGVRSHLYRQNRLRHPRPLARAASCQQAGAAQSAQSPEIAPNTNGSENDIRCQVTRRKVSGAISVATRARPAPSPASASGATSAHGSISRGATVPPLPNLIRATAQKPLTGAIFASVTWIDSKLL